MRIFRLLLIGGWLAISASFARADDVHTQMPTDPAALDVTQIFADGCLHNALKLDRVSAWAAQQKLPQVTLVDALRIFVGPGPGGGAWVARMPTTDIVIAVRSTTDACAVYGEHADATDFARLYEIFLHALTPAGGKVVRQPDRIEKSPYGAHTGKFTAIFAPDGRISTFVMMTFEKPGGPYQVSMQLSPYVTPSKPH